MNHVPPSIKENAFNCPHCDVFARQLWHSLRTRALEATFPFDRFKTIIQKIETQARPEKGSSYLFRNQEHFEETRRVSREDRVRMGEDGVPVLMAVDTATTAYDPELHNVFVSECTHCEQLCVWIHDKQVYPPTGSAPRANSDLPAAIRADYDEANSILDKSPRGSAALLRLAIQKLCRELGQTGEHLDKDIATLVKNGLDSRVKKALDIVRVAGNNAVHPGEMDLRDDRATAESLFWLLNQIAEDTISKDKRINAIYEKLPEKERKRIEKRDGGGK